VFISPELLRDAAPKTYGHNLSVFNAHIFAGPFLQKISGSD
jgi:hypothetical protein